MKIGFIRQESLNVKDGENTKVVKWLECYFRFAGAMPFQVKMSKNKKDENSTANQPDYNLYMRGNLNKYDTFRDLPIGALWLGTTVKDGETLNFMTGYIESPIFNKLNIAVWRAKPNYEGEKLGYMYDINSMEDKPQDENQNNYTQYQQPQQAPQAQIQDGDTPTIDIDDDEIPF